MQIQSFSRAAFQPDGARRSVPVQSECQGRPDRFTRAGAIEDDKSSLEWIVTFPDGQRRTLASESFKTAADVLAFGKERYPTTFADFGEAAKFEAVPYCSATLQHIEAAQEDSVSKKSPHSQRMEGAQPARKIFSVGPIVTDPSSLGFMITFPDGQKRVEYAGATTQTPEAMLAFLEKRHPSTFADFGDAKVSIEPIYKATMQRISIF